MNTTKEKILTEALASFAVNGYKGTNLRDLAAALGLSKSALYKHYNSKEEIWNAVLDSMEAYYAARFGTPENLPEIPASCEELTCMTKRMLEFTMRDPKIILTRQLLLTEQFRNERVRMLATRHFLTGTQEMYKKIFAEMMKNGVLRQDDPEMLAFAYTAPITSLIHFSDREPGKEPEIMRKIEAFINHFILVYGLK